MFIDYSNEKDAGFVLVQSVPILANSQDDDILHLIATLSRLQNIMISQNCMCAQTSSWIGIYISLMYYQEYPTWVIRLMTPLSRIWQPPYPPAVANNPNYGSLAKKKKKTKKRVKQSRMHKRNYWTVQHFTVFVPNTKSIFAINIITQG